MGPTESGPTAWGPDRRRLAALGIAALREPAAVIYRSKE